MENKTLLGEGTLQGRGRDSDSRGKKYLFE